MLLREGARVALLQLRQKLRAQARFRAAYCA
jgi:hypothetical protein